METRRTTEPTETQARPAGSRDADEAVVTTVGTFAAGQSERGMFDVAVEAGLGTFADGVAVEPPVEPAVERPSDERPSERV